MKLSSRLYTIFNMYQGEVAADVGSDHGKLIISLFQEHKIKKGYAIENKRGPYSKLYKEIETNKLLNNVIPMFSDGISELPNDTDSIIVAGMGGNLIINIINSHIENLKNVNYIYVDAHNNVPEVRRFICGLGYEIMAEAMVLEKGIYYEIIGFKKGHQTKMDEFDYLFGPFLRKEKSKIFINKYLDRINEIEHIIEIPNIPKEKMDALEKEKGILQEVIS